MRKTTSIGMALIIACLAHGATAQTSSGSIPQPRPEPPIRKPDSPGTPSLTPCGWKPGDPVVMRGAPGANPPVNAEGDFLIGPDYVPAPEMSPIEGVPKGAVRRFTMRSEDSKFYPGITKVPPGGRPALQPPDLTHVRDLPQSLHAHGDGLRSGPLRPGHARAACL